MCEIAVPLFHALLRGVRPVLGVFAETEMSFVEDRYDTGKRTGQITGAFHELYRTKRVSQTYSETHSRRILP